MNIIPKDGRGRPAKTNWERMLVGDSVIANRACAHYWNKKIKGAKFVARGNRVYRTK